MEDILGVVYQIIIGMLKIFYNCFEYDLFMFWSDSNSLGFCLRIFVSFFYMWLFLILYY